MYVCIYFIVIIILTGRQLSDLESSSLRASLVRPATLDIQTFIFTIHNVQAPAECSVHVSIYGICTWQLHIATKEQSIILNIAYHSYIYMYWSRNNMRGE